MSPTIRPIEARDIAGFHECFDQVAREQRFLASSEAPPLAALAAFVQHNIANGHAQYVALVAGKVVGWCDAVPYQRPPGYRHRAVLGMGVAAAHRRRGIGEGLLRAVIAHAWKAGLRRIDLDVRADNEAAIRLYEKTGFRREGTRVRALCVQGDYFDLVTMGLLHHALA